MTIQQLAGMVTILETVISLDGKLVMATRAHGGISILMKMQQILSTNLMKLQKIVMILRLYLNMIILRLIKRINR